MGKLGQLISENTKFGLLKSGQVNFGYSRIGLGGSLGCYNKGCNEAYPCQCGRAQHIVWKVMWQRSVSMFVARFIKVNKNYNILFH